MAFVRAERQGECLPDLLAVNQMMPYFYAAVRWDNIYEVASWSRGNSWYYAERACSFPLGVEPPCLFETDEGHCWLERGHLSRSRPPQRRLPFKNQRWRWWQECYQRQAGDVHGSTWCISMPESYHHCHRVVQQQKCQCWRRCSNWRSPAAIIRVGLSHRILPNDQEEGCCHEGKQDEAMSGSNGTVWLRIDICKGDGIDEHALERLTWITCWSTSWQQFPLPFWWEKWRAHDFHVKFHPQVKTPGGSYQSLNRYPIRCGYWWMFHTLCAPMAQQRIHRGCSVELRHVCHQQDEQLQRTHVIFDRYNRTRSSRILTRCQRGFKGIQTDDERSTTATASCPLSYEKRGPANLPDVRRTSKTWWCSP